MKKLRIILWMLLHLISCLSFAQNRISLTNRNPIYMDFTRSFNAGQPKQIITDDSQWLNYTTLVQLSEPTISITIEVVSGSIPNGLELQVEAVPYKGISRGKLGTPRGKMAVTHMPRVLISNIGTCYTGFGRNEGYQLIFSFIIKDYSKLRSGTSTIYVQYTITQ